MVRPFQAPLLGVVRAMANAFHSTRCRRRRRHVAVRVPEICAALAAAPPGFVFIVGNSHAEGTGIELDMLRPVINGRIGGISAAAYAVLVGKRPFLGSNDIQRKASPLSLPSWPRHYKS